jgi:hypothetical protein
MRDGAVFLRIGVTEEELLEAVRLIKLSNNMTGPVMPSPATASSAPTANILN